MTEAGEAEGTAFNAMVRVEENEPQPDGPGPDEPDDDEPDDDE